MFLSTFKLQQMMSDKIFILMYMVAFVCPSNIDIFVFYMIISHDDMK